MCQYCEDRPADLCLTLTTPDGTVLDQAAGCADCLRAGLASLDLHPGNVIEPRS
jgi:hypothetical protein